MIDNLTAANMACGQQMRQLEGWMLRDLANICFQYRVPIPHAEKGNGFSYPFSGFASVLLEAAGRRDEAARREAGADKCPCGYSPQACAGSPCPKSEGYVPAKPDAPPPPADDLVTRCRSWANNCTGYLADALREAAAAIEALRAERDAVLALIPAQFLDPPDGGEVKPVELVRRLVPRVAALEGALWSAKKYACQLARDTQAITAPEEITEAVADLEACIDQALAAGGGNG